MRNFQIQLAYPWLLLLLIPAIALTLLPYFKLSKRHRRTRNRVISIVLHSCIMVLSICTLCGMTFAYQLPNKENEIILLVDLSDSEADVQAKRDEFVEFVLQQSAYDGYKVGVVTFGYDQVYAAELTYDVDEVFDKYLSAEWPDTTATNIASALTYTRDLFTNKQSAKIVLITDGKETDDDASIVIRSIASQGIKLDVAEISQKMTECDVQISGVELPEYHMVADTEYTASVTVQTNQTANVTLDVFDNGMFCSTLSKELKKGTHTLMPTVSFHKDGLHEITFKISVPSGDKITDNDLYYAYYYLENFNNLLILEREEHESDKLVAMLNDQQEYDITVMDVMNPNVPTDLSALCQYDTVILNNISNADMNLINNGIGATYNGKNISYAELLQIYVSECGGGMLTVGGNKEVEIDGKKQTVANAYNRADLYKSVYQSMLPVEAENYTPPLGVMFILDISGSMSGELANGSTRLDWARDGMEGAIQQMNRRDYVGIMTFDSYLNALLPLTPRTHQTKIEEVLNNLKKQQPTGGTVASNAIFHAGQMLDALEDVDKRHIVLVTDAGLADAEKCMEALQTLYTDRGITMSIVAIDVAESERTKLEAITNVAGGEDAGSNVIIEAASDALISEMEADLNTPALKEIEEGAFNPIVNNIRDDLKPLVKELTRLEENDKKLAVTLDGFYGVKARASADVVLMGKYEVPLYAQWKYGEGTVGSFMSDLNGVYSKEFMSRNPETGKADGQTFIKNVVNNLMPAMSIRPNDISISLKADNYTNTLNVYADVDTKNGEYLKGSIYNAAGELIADMGKVSNAEERLGNCYVTTSMNEENGYSRCSFVIKKGGTYRIVISKHDKQGNTLATFETYKSFSYSKEYDVYLPTDEAALAYTEKLTELAKNGNGAMIEDLDNPWEIHEGFIINIDKVFDPRFLFMIIAITLFLLDIAVRKFKFKWPHELIREYKAKKDEQKNA